MKENLKKAAEPISTAATLTTMASVVLYMAFWYSGHQDIAMWFLTATGISFILAVIAFIIADV